MLTLLLATSCQSLVCGLGTTEIDGSCLPTEPGTLVGTETADPTDSAMPACETVDIWDVTVENDPDRVTQSELGFQLDGIGTVSAVCELVSPPPAESRWIQSGHVWRYLDTGEAPDLGWQAPGFDDGAWGLGPSPLGYGDNEITEVGWGDDPELKYPTTWFRTTVTLGDLSNISQATLKVRRDDGVIVSLNGTEVLRDNLPLTGVDSETLASSSVSGSSESVLVEVSLDLSLLVQGENTFAAEVHQATLASSDLMFDLELWVTLPGELDQAGETHVLTASEEAPYHELLLQGLLGSAVYGCQATTSCPSVSEPFEFEVATQPLPDHLPSFEVVVPATADSWGDYVLLNHGEPCGGDDQNRLLVIDHQGRIRWYFELEGLDQASTIDLESQYLGDGQIAWGGGDRSEGSPQIVDISGEILYTAAYTGAQDHVYHHDIEVTADGRIMGLINTDDSLGPQSWEGFALIEHDPATGEVTWAFYSQDAVDVGDLAGDGSRDPWHANSFAKVTDAQGAAVYVSFLDDDQIVRIDRETKAVSWRLGAGGDFALVDAAGEPLDESEWFDGMHAIDVRNGNELMVYDNGRSATGSRAMMLKLDTTNRVATLAWSYVEDNWFEPIWGDADTLENGNVLINMAHAYCWGGSDDHWGSLLELDTADNSPVWRVDFTSGDDSSYRSQKLDGCEIFANATLCPDRMP
jgi:hypothetical protein